MISRSSHLLSIDEAGEPCQWLLPRAADTHQQGTATGIGGDATNTSTHVARGTWHVAQHPTCSTHVRKHWKHPRFSKFWAHHFYFIIFTSPPVSHIQKQNGSRRIEADRGTTDVQHRIVEKHKIHGGVLVVVSGKPCLRKKIEEFRHEAFKQSKDFQRRLSPPPRPEFAACPEQANKTSLHQKPHDRIYKD